MHKIDTTRRICLPVFDPTYNQNSSRSQLPLIQQQQHHTEHQPSGKERSPKCQVVVPSSLKNVSFHESEGISRVEDKTDENTVREKEQKLKRVKVGKWRSLNVDPKQRNSRNDESVTKGRLHVLMVYSYHVNRYFS